MKVSLSWLKELVDYKLTPKELAEKLSLVSIGVKETGDDFLELDLTYNRGDLLSLRGVARELTAITESQLKFDSEIEYIWEGKNLPKVKVEVQDNKLCPLYCVAKIEGLKVKPSSKEWVKKLTDCGIRSIDTITDITNLMMLEYGQTMHAFDAIKVSDETMIIRLAKDSEQFATLDGKVRKLTKDDLLITDPKGILSLSGIMGGKDSEVTENTKTILLEVAIFDPVSIRRSSQRFGLHSEASKRIQHGLTKTNLLQALSAGIKMYEGLGGKLVGLSLVGDLEDKPKTIQLTQEKINSLLGVDIPPEQVECSLTKLGFKLASQGDALKGSPSWNVEVPYWRLDIDIEEDLVEEIARMYGYEEIPSAQLKGELPKKIDQSLFDNIAAIKNKLIELGLTEVQTYSFYSTDVLRNTGKDKYLEYFIKIANPISSETEYLRCDLWPNLVEVVAKNIKHGFNDIAIFELSKVYLLQVDRKKIVDENYRLAIALVNGTDNPMTELYQIISHLGGITLGTTEPDEYAKDYFHPKRFAFLKRDRKTIGGIAEVHPRIVNRFGVDKRIAILECDIIT